MNAIAINATRPDAEGFSHLLRFLGAKLRRAMELAGAPCLVFGA